MLFHLLLSSTITPHGCNIFGNQSKQLMENKTEKYSSYYNLLYSSFFWWPVLLKWNQTCKFSYKSRNSHIFLENCKFAVQQSPKEMLYLFILKWVSKNISLDTALFCLKRSSHPLYKGFWNLSLRTFSCVLPTFT